MEVDLGIFGGMGLLAETHFLRLFLKECASRIPSNYTGNSHTHIDERKMPSYICFANPKRPSRSRHIFFDEESPEKLLCADIKFLGTLGVKCIAIPCMTVHYYLESMREHTDAHIISILDHVGIAIDRLPDGPTLVICSEATSKVRMLDRYTNRDLIYTQSWELVRNIIDGVKKGDDLTRLGKHLKSVMCGYVNVVLACTELSIILDHENYTSINLSLIHI